jgi:hypothetical protein
LENIFKKKVILVKYLKPCVKKDVLFGLLVFVESLEKINVERN